MEYFLLYYFQQLHLNFHYYFPFFRGTGITTQESVVIERHADKESFAGACDDLRIGVTLIFYLQNAAEYLQQREKGNILPGGQGRKNPFSCRER